MQQVIDLDPVMLRYAAALRGVVPPMPETPFHYVRWGMPDQAMALSLAASNPEGQFSFIVADEPVRQAAELQRQKLRLKNCAFLRPEAVAALRQVQFLCADLRGTGAADMAAVQALAGAALAPGGLFACHYAPFTAGQDGLHFMVAEFAPEMTPAQQPEFLTELQQLGTHYFAKRPAAAQDLAVALASQAASAYLQRQGAGQKAHSATVQMIAGMTAQGCQFVGDANVQANYLEMMVPAAAQPLLGTLRPHLLYEVIKDFATDRASRADIWVKQPVAMSSDLAALFGPFYFGLAETGAGETSQVTLHGRTLDVTAPIFQAWLTLLRLMPLTIGDFLSHPQAAGFTPQDAVMAINALVAFQIALPMRASFGGLGRVDFSYPRLAGGYNQQLQQQAIAAVTVLLASPVAGRPVQASLSEALVLQAVGRVGLAESADALMPELQRLAADPALAPQLFVRGADIAPDFVETMIRDVCQQRMPNWYVLGILDAA